MDAGVDVKYELNEIEWWAHWVEVTWLTQKTYMMQSPNFNEAFFNRAGFIAAEADWPEIIPKMEFVFEHRNLRPCVYLPVTDDFSTLGERLVARGYRITDRMSVMELRKPSFQVNPEISVEVTRPPDAKKWCEVYLRSFYGDLQLLSPTLEVVRKSMESRNVSFVSALHERSIVGTLAMYKSREIVGIFCVGTMPSFRKMGVANTVMRFASDISKEMGATMILQTMLSDNVERLYLKMGLVASYRKEVYEQFGQPHS